MARGWIFGMNKPLHPDQLRDLIPLNALSPRQLWELRARTVPLVLTAGEVLELDERRATTRYYLMSGSCSSAMSRATGAARGGDSGGAA